MANFGVIVDGIVINLIVADSKEIAETVTGFTCIESTEENPAFIDGDYVDGYFYNTKPFASWIRDGKGEWTAPVPMPEFDESNPMEYFWNEETISWDGIPIVESEY